MTPKVHPKSAPAESALPELPSAPDSSPPCQTNCHAPSASFGPPRKGALSLIDSDKKAPLTRWERDALAAWAKGNHSPLAQPEKEISAPPPPKDDPQVYLDKAREQEDQASLTPSSRKHLMLLESALLNYQLAKDVESAKRVLGSMKKHFKAQGNDVALAKLDGELHFIEGNFPQALKELRAVESVLKDSAEKLTNQERDTLLGELNLKISMVHRAHAAQLSHGGQWKEALTEMESALRRTPTPALAGEAVAILNRAYRPQEIIARMEALEKTSWLLLTFPCSTQKKDPLSLPLEFTIKDHSDDLFWVPKDNREAFRLNQKDIENTKAEYERWAQKVAWITRTGFGEAKEGKALVTQELALVEVFRAQGDHERVLTHLQDLLQLLPEKKRDVEQIQLRAGVAHHLALTLFQKGEGYRPGIHFDAAYGEALQVLEKTFAELEGLPQEGSPRLLTLQNRFLYTQVRLAQANSPEEVKAVRDVLEANVTRVPVRHLSSQDPARALVGRMMLRLAQIEMGIEGGKVRANRWVEEILMEFPKDAYLGSQALLARGLSHLETEGKSLEGLGVLRQLQVQYPGTEADQSIRSAQNMANLRDETGILRENLQESDFSEAFKMALEKAVNTGPRKLGFIGLGVVAVAILVPEPSTTAFGLGALAGLSADMGLGVYQGREQILDAYRSGISTVDATRSLQNIFLLGVDIALLVTAGAGGSLVRKGMELGMSRLAVGTSEFLSRMALTAGERALLTTAGRGAHRFLPFVGESMSAYTFYTAGKSLAFGEDFHWDAKEALMMSCMMGSFALARRMGVGAKVATGPKFSHGKLKPVFHEGKVVGFSNSAGRVVGWTTDTVLGASVFYGGLFGANQAGLHGMELPNYAHFLGDQIYTLGALHLGNKLLPHSFGRSLQKLDQKSQVWLKKARENIESEPFDGGSSGFGPQLATATAGINVPLGPGVRWNIKTPSKPWAIKVKSLFGGATAKPGSKQASSPRQKVNEVEDVIRRDANLRQVLSKVLENGTLKELPLEVLEVFYNLSQKPATYLARKQGKENFLAEILNQSHGQKIFDFLMNLRPEAANALRGLSGGTKGAHPNSWISRFFDTPLMFEVPRGVEPGLGYKYGDLVLEAYWHLKGVKGVQEALELTTRVIDNETKSQQGEPIYDVQYDGPWRGRVDEFIRAGLLYSQAMGMGSSDRLASAIGKQMGKVKFKGFSQHSADGDKAPTVNLNDPMELDLLQRNNWAHEYKSTYSEKGPGRFSLIKPNGAEAAHKQKIRFMNQVMKFKKAIKDGIIKGVEFHITASEIGPEVLALINSTLPSYKIYRYNSIADTKGELVAMRVSQETFLETNKHNVILNSGKTIRAYRLFGLEELSVRPITNSEGYDALEGLEIIYGLSGYTYGIGAPSTLGQVRLAQNMQLLPKVLERLPRQQGLELEEAILEIALETNAPEGPETFHQALKEVEMVLEKTIKEEGIGELVEVTEIQ